MTDHPLGNPHPYQGTAMRLSLCIPSLMALAIAPNVLHAVSITDEGFSLTFKGQIQARMDFGAGGTNEAGAGVTNGAEAYDPLRGVTGDADLFRFDFRRVRLGLEAKYGDGWQGNFVLSSEKNDVSESGKNSRAVNLYYAYITKTIKDGDLTHVFRGGLDKIFNNDSIISSSSALMPNDRPTQALTSYRNLGLGYRLLAPIFDIGVDVMNNTSGAKPTGANENSSTDNANTRNGFTVAGRFEVAPSSEMMITPDKRKESYLGKAGTGIVFGIEVQAERNRLEAAAAGTSGIGSSLAPGAVLGGTNPYVVRNNTVWGPDVLVHWDALTFLAEWRAGKTSRMQYNDAGQDSRLDDVPLVFWSVQAGYAFPVGSMVLEPALRYSVMDMNRNVENYANYCQGFDYGDVNYKNGNSLQDMSGRQLEIGVNLYEKGTSCKTQLEYLNWHGESGNGSAHMFILQQQFTF